MRRSRGRGRSATGLSRVLASVGRVEPLIAETLRYFLASTTAMLRLPSAIVWAFARSFGFVGAEQRSQLAEAVELIAAAQLFLGDVKRAHGPRKHAHYNGIALLWADIALSRSLVTLFQLSGAVAATVLDGAVRTFEADLLRQKAWRAAGPHDAMALSHAID